MSISDLKAKLLTVIEEYEPDEPEDDDDEFEGYDDPAQGHEDYYTMLNENITLIEREDAWRQLVADLLGVPVLMIEDPEDVRYLMVRS